ncbi:MAG TPA: glucose-1-phosphate adenylyltransferase [Nitrospiria bacterium]|nr:glucose-1-phosphate adenylyltransferase [Nitrospiria bacterium]
MQIHESTLTIVLAGGAGSRLAPLTADRAKPAVPFGGIYRIIDFTLSNCLHSGLRRILVLTQYKSHSLLKHLRDGWMIFNPEIGEFITSVPAQMRVGEGWYAGTADAIRQNRYLLERSGATHVLVLAGDHIYRMDYARMLEEHARRKWDVTVACVPVPLDQAHAFGVVETDGEQGIRKFVEKSDHPPPMPDAPDRALASMGIYVFKLNFLLGLLAHNHDTGAPMDDFGRHILPALVGTHAMGVYRFGKMEERVTPDGYWRDVGTLDAYYEANMDLLKPLPPLNLYQKDWPIRTYHAQHPPARSVPSSSDVTRSNSGQVVNTLLAGGDVIIGATLAHSILSPDVWINAGATVEDAILFEGVTVGTGARLKRCIIDKSVTIPPNETIGWDLDRDRSRFTVSENGVVVVPKSYRFEGDG